MAFLAHMVRDVLKAFGAIRRTPMVSLVVIGSFAVGIGVNTTVFSWIESRVLTPMPGVSRGSDFYLVEARGETGGYPGFSWPEYIDLTKELKSFRELIAFRMAPLTVGVADWSDRAYGVLVSGNYFTALGLRAGSGRLIEEADTAVPGGAPIVVISHRFWQNRLAGATDVVGRDLRINEKVLTIVGVAPPDFAGSVMGLTFDLYVPATAIPLLQEGSRELERREMRGYMALGSLRPGASLRDAESDLGATMREMARVHPGTSAAVKGEVKPQWQSPRGPQRSLMGALVVLQGAMLLVLAVVAGNTTNLMLARASGRVREAGVMLALGAGRWRVVSLILTENIVLALLGAGLGALIAVWGTNALRAVPMPTPGGLQVSFVTDVDGISLLFATALGIVAGIAIGLPAALQLSRISPHLAMRSAGMAPGRSQVRDVLLALETALAIVVIALAAQFVKDFRETQTVSPGFKKEGVLLATYDLRGRNRGVPPAQAADFAARLLDRLRASPTIESAALATSVPLDIHGMPSRMFEVEGHTRPDGALDQALTNIVSPGYFEAMGIPLVAGSDFAPLGGAMAPEQAVVNEEFVRRFVGSGEPIGRRIDTAGRLYTIAGVVRDSRYNSFSEPPAPFIYLSLRDRPSAMLEIHARARRGDPEALAADLRAALRDLDPTLPLYNVRTLAGHVESNLVFQRIPARMFVVLGPMILGLVAVGIYAVVSYSVAGRRKEIGTRMALGATAARVSADIVRDTLRVVGFGLVAGVVLVLLIDSDAFAGRRSDLLLFIAVTLTFVATAITASWLPARRAGRIDPLTVLKQE